MMHWQTNNAFSHFGRNGQVLLGGAGKATVGRKVTDEGVKVTTAIDSMLPHLEI